MNNQLISVILPIYNVGEYLEKSLNSIINQSYRNIEVILIDDGSTDDSGEICDKFAERDQRVIVYHQSNKGLVSSWKRALSIAKGKWIAFVDPDDYIGKNYLESMLDAAKNFDVDMVIAPFKKVLNGKVTDTNSDLKPGFYEGNKYKKMVLESLLSNGHFQSRLLPPNRWGKLIKKDDLLKNSIYVDNSVTYGEDLNILFPIFIGVNSIYFLDELENNCYFYRVHKKSMINNYDKNRWSSVKKVYSSLKNRLYLEKEDSESYDSLYSQLVMDCSAAFVQSYKNEFKNPEFKFKMLDNLIYDMRCQDMYVDIKSGQYSQYSLLQRIILFDIVNGNKITHYIMYYILKMGISFKKRGDR